MTSRVWRLVTVVGFLLALVAMVLVCLGSDLWRVVLMGVNVGYWNWQVRRVYGETAI
jgi:hypothetical protein